MKKLICMLALVLASTMAFGQNAVTTFLGIPVDGTKAEMKQKLISKGFEYNHISDGIEFFTGEFNGRDVRVYIVTNNNKVWRIMVAETKTCSEGQIKIRYNRLVDQFMNNKRYYSNPLLESQKLSDEEDISYEMSVHDKQYEAIFYQRDLEFEREEMENYLSENKEKLAALSPEDAENVKKLRQSVIEMEGMESMFKRQVWFTISKFNGEYYIAMYYDNENNRANGEDL